MANHRDRTITIQLSAGDMSDNLRLDDFLEEMNTLRTALRETERLVSGKEPSLYFRIKHLQKNSPARVTLEAVSDEKGERSQPQYASYVVRSLTTNLRMIANNKRPKRVDVPTLESYRDIALPAERRHLEVTNEAGNHSVLINRGFREILDSIVGEDEFSYGSISGTIEAINLHDRKKFWLYPVVGPTRVVGKFRSKERKQYADAVDKYVTVYGRLRYKTWAEHPYAINADKLVIHDKAVPTLHDLKGMAPNATGDLTSEEFINEIRDGW